MLRHPTVVALLARAVTFALHGIDAVEVALEADIHTGLPSFTIVGLPDAAVQESRERVRAALVNSGFEFPLRRITVNLAPADLRKAGPGFDLGLAAGVLAASGQVPAERLARYALAGELGLDGSVRPVRGALAMADAYSRGAAAALVLPHANAAEASLVEGVKVLGIETLHELGDLLTGAREPQPVEQPPQPLLDPDCEGTDLGEVRGHRALKRAIEVAAAGGHNVLMIGPPGSGKSMIARRLPSVMPPLCMHEALEVTRIHSVAGLLGGAPVVRRRPFRAPHHSISSAGLVGGGSLPTPGEATLAQHGVLFLDELAEYSRPALEALRQPLEDGHVTIVRSQRCVRFPARFMLVAATNPCPCGHAGDPRRECACLPSARHRYNARLSGPLLDRIDMIVHVDPPTRDELMDGPRTQTSREVRERVLAARTLQAHRLAGTPARCNGDMTASQVERICRLRGDAHAALHAAHERVGLTVRGHHRVLRVARTLADLARRTEIERRDVAEAVAYREYGLGGASRF